MIPIIPSELGTHTLTPTMCDLHPHIEPQLQYFPAHQSYKHANLTSSSSEYSHLNAKRLKSFLRPNAVYAV
jgi:hypothetical protein